MKFKIIKVKDLYFVFNENKTAWIAVTEEAVPFCRKFIEGSLNTENLTDDEKQVLGALKNLQEMNCHVDKENSVKSCYIHITQHCNLNCPMCYSKDEMRNKFVDLPLDTWKENINNIRNAGFERLVFSGGEPLIYPHIKEVLEYCSTLKFHEIVLITNGLLITDDILETLKNNVDSLCVSLDGYNEEINKKVRGEGNFEKTVSKIKLLRENNIPVNIIATIYKENIDDIKKYTEFANKLNCTISFSLFTKSGEALKNQEMEQSKEQLEGLTKYLLEGDMDEIIFDNIPVVKGITYKENCGAGEYLISVNADGNVYPCHFMMKSELCMGNLSNESIETILSKGICHHNAMNVNNISECKDCDYKYLCGGGCRAHVYKGLECKLEKSEDCAFYKRYYDHILEEIG